jgi:hypothetical protein
MTPSFALPFLDLIESELQRASKGLSSSHYLHNIRSGIANIVDLIEYDRKIADAADHLVRMAASYIDRRDAVSITIAGPEAQADADRFHGAGGACRFPRRTGACAAELQGSHAGVGVRS